MRTIIRRLLVIAFTVAVVEAFQPTLSAMPGAGQPPIAASAFTRAIRFLADGKQADAEQLIQDQLQSESNARQPLDADEVFLLAVCTRSRFEIDNALPMFIAVTQLAPNTLHGRAAADIIRLDQHDGDPEAQFADLDQLCAANPDDPLILWMVGVQCRTLNKVDIGVVRYRKLCTMWDPGPVLVHQTFANVLDDAGKYDESLIHRRIAVRLEPEGWAYEGLANTLTHLKRWGEADAAYAKCTGMEPDNVHYWNNWAWSKHCRGDAEGEAEMEAKVAQIQNGTAPAN